MSTPPRDFREWMRSVERKLAQAVRTGNSAAITALNNEAEAIREEIVAGAGDARTPAAPVEFTVQTSLHVDDNGRTYGRLLLDFSTVTKATNGTNLLVDYYELWGRDETTWLGAPEDEPEWKLLDTANNSTFYSLPFTPGSNWRFRVRAIGTTTPIPGAWSIEITTNIGADTEPPPIPSAVVLSQKYSVITIEWDGLAANGASQPADYSHTEIALAGTSSPTAIHTLFRGADSTVVAGRTLGAPTYVRSRSVDFSGNKSSWSAQRQITPTALVSGDISGLDVTLADQIARSEAAEEAALESANEALQAANEAATAAAAATAAQGNADTAAAEAAASAASAATLNAEATAARAAADQAAADAAAAELAATQAEASAAQALADLQYNMESAGRIIRQEAAPTGADANTNNLWIKDSTGESFTWDATAGEWELVDNATYAAAAQAADAAADRAEAAEAAAVQAELDAAAAETAATAAAGTATTAQQAAAAAQAEASDSAAAAAASQSAAEAAESMATAADAKADTAEANALAAVGIANAKGKVYAQPEAPANDPNGMWIDTDAGNAVRVLTKKKALYRSEGGGSNANLRFITAGWDVTVTTEALTLAMLEGYDALVLDSGYAGLATSTRNVATQAWNAGYSIFSAGNDTVAFAPMFTGTASRGTEKSNDIIPVPGHPVADGAWPNFKDPDGALYLTGVNASAVVVATTLVAGVAQPQVVAMEHATNTARWVHIQPYAVPANLTIAAANWMASRWRFVQDQNVLDAAAEAVAARNAADAAEAAAVAAQGEASAAQVEAANSAAEAAGALADATTAQNAAVAAQNAADAAEARADAAEAAAAQSAADASQSMTDLQAYLGTSGRTIYQEATPTGDDRNKNNLWIKPSDGSSYIFDPTLNSGAGAWVVVVNAVVAQAAFDADAARDAADAAEAAATQSAADALAAQQAATAAEGNADALTAAAQQAAVDAAAADQRAAAAEAAATAAENSASQSFADVQALMETSGRIIYQDAAPAVEDQSPNNLWIKDSTGEAFAWDTSQSAWVLVQSDVVTNAALNADAAADRAEAAEAAAVAARNDATSAQGSASTAQTAAAAAQAEAAAAEARADAAEAAAAASAADAQAAQAAADQSFNDLQGFLDDAGKIIRQDAEPAVADRNVNNLWIKNSTGEPYTWVPTANGGAGAWVIVTDQRVVDMALAADNAADAAEAAEAASAAAQAASTAAQQNAAASAGTATTAQQNAQAAQAAANQAQAEADAAAAAAAASAADAAQSAADADAAAQAAGSSSAAALLAQEAAENAQSAADDAVITANTAASAAADAEAAALEAAGLAASKGKVWFQTDPPPAGAIEDERANDLWVDTNDNNKPHRWNSTTNAWVVVDDPRIVTALNNAATADGKAAAAQTAANNAASAASAASALAGEAKDTADDALSAATHAGKAFFSADPPSGSAPKDSTWQQYDVDGDIIGSWQQTGGTATTDGSTWVKRQLTSAQFDNFDAGKITFGTMSGSRITAGTLTISVAEVPALPTSKITSLDSSLSTLTASAQAAMVASAYSSNPSFDEWTATTPAFTSSWGSTTPTKDTTFKRVGAHGMNFNVTSALTTAGVNTSAMVSHMPDVEYVTFEVEFMLKSGTLSGAGIQFQWGGKTNNTVKVDFAAEVPNVTLNKWHRLTVTVPRNANSTGTLTSYISYLFANYDQFASPRTVKNITYDWLNMRPATEQEIDAFLAKQMTDGWVKSGTTFIDGGKLFNDSVTTLALAANAVEADNIMAGAVTAQKLTASLVLATEIIAGDPLGTHASMDENGFRVFAEDLEDGVPNEVVRMGVAATDDYFAISRDDGTLAASMSEDGKISGVQVIARDAIWYKGRELSSVLADLPQGVVAYGDAYTGFTNIGNEFGIFDVAVTLKPNRAYELTLYSAFSSSTSSGNVIHRVRIQHGGITAPTLGSDLVKAFEFPSTSTLEHTGAVTWLWYPQVAVDTPVRLLLTLQKYGGGTANWHRGEMIVKDVGIPRKTGGTVNNGGGTTAPPVEVRQAQWGPTNSRSYDGANNTYPMEPTRMYQGLSPAGYGNLKSIATFGDLTATLSGATINWIRVYFNFQHWYYNAGGTARIGVHGHSSVPSTFSGNGVVATSGGWPKPGARWVDLPSSVFAGFKSGAYKGVYLEGDTSYGTYGFADRPSIEINYTK